MKKNYLFTSESVSEGHPDKVCDRISDMVVDTYLSSEPQSRVACETLTTTNKVVLAGETRGPEIKKDEFIYISKKVFKFYLTDPSNFEEKFLRTRIRNYLDKFKLDGLDINKIKLTLSNLQSANESINFYKEKSIKNHVRYLQRNACFVSYGLFNYESEEVIFRTINDIISKISDGYYPPRGKDVKNLISRIQSEKFKKSTLGGCIIEKTYNILIFRKEFEA